MINITSYEADIKSALSRAQSAFDAAKNRTPAERADICLDILNFCADFRPAIQELQRPPEAVKNLLISIDTVNCYVMLNWARSVEKGVVYTILRKPGKDAPRNERDGDVVKDDSTDTSFKDERVQPGTYYSYSVFAKRKGIYSSPESKSVVLVADVTRLSHEQNGTTIRITWDLPKNATGATVIKEHNGRQAVVADNAHSSYEDRNVEYSKSYAYTIQANYFGLPSSRGTSIVVTPQPQIDHFQISAVQIGDNKYKVSWSISRRDIDLCVLVDDKVVRNVVSHQRECELALPKNGFHVIKVAALSGGDWLMSQNAIDVNTYASCEVDRNHTQIIEKPFDSANGTMYRIDFSIKITEPIPNNAIAFWYVVRTKSAHDSNVPWADANEITVAPDALRVSTQTYKEKGTLVYSGTIQNEDAFYITMFTIYNVNGKQVISAPFKRKFMRPLDAHILWKVIKPLIGKAKLHIELRANRLIYKRPKMVLCSCASDTHIISQRDAKASIVMEIDEVEFSRPQKDFKWDFETPAISKGSKLFLFEADPVDNSENYMFSWASNFKGRV